MIPPVLSACPRPAWSAVWAVFVLAATGCTAAPLATTPAGGMLPPAPAGWRLGHAARAASPALAALIRDERTTPITAAFGVYIPAATDAGARPSAAVTVTVAHYTDASGAQATYNQWFATFGFMPSAERAPLGLGEQAERFDAGAPPLHAAVARAGRRFALVEAGPSVDPAARSGVIETLLAAGLAAAEPESP